MTTQPPRIWRCDLRPQYLAYKSEILHAVSKVLDSGRYTLATEVKDFEQEFKNYVSASFGVGVGNATEGLTLALKACGVSAGDEVITTTYTAIPTISAIVATGAQPIFVDIDPATFLIDLEKVSAVLSSKTKAVVPVHLFGNVVDIPKLRNMLPSEVAIVEDAAQAHGCSIENSPAGSMGDAGVFSFYPTKNLGGYGDGGIVVTSNEKLHNELRLLHHYGMVDKDHIVRHGINSRLDELQAAILRVKLPHLDAMNERRRQLAARYRAELPETLFSYQKFPEGVVCNFHVFAAKIAPGLRDKLVAFLEQRGIQSNIYYLLPLHLQEANLSLGYSSGDFPHAEKLCGESIALPMYPELSDQAQDVVIRATHEFATEFVN